MNGTTEQLGLCIGREAAAADLTTHQFKAIKFTATGVNLTALGGECDGFLQNNPDSGEPATVCVNGISKAVASGALAKGALVTVDATGKLIAPVAGNYIIGKVLKAAAADGDIVPVMINRYGRSA